MSKANSKKSLIYAVLVAVAGIVTGSGILVASASAEEAAKVDREAARELFHAYSCSACHALTDAGARAAFDALSYSRRKEVARSVSEAKRPETRERRIAAAVAEVSGS